MALAFEVGVTIWASDRLNGRSLEFRNRIAREASSVAYLDGEPILTGGTIGTSLFLIEAGAVRHSIVGLDGQRLTTATLVPGDAYLQINLRTGRFRHRESHAIGAVSILVLGQAPFCRLVNDEPELRDFVIRHLSRRLIRTQEDHEDPCLVRDQRP